MVTRLRRSALPARWVCLAALATALCCVAQAHAEPGWILPAEALQPTRPLEAQTEPVLATDAAGDATAAMVQEEGGVYRIRLQQRPAGGPWGAPVTVPSGPSPDAPELAEGPEGETSLVWSEGNETVWASRQGAGGSWQSPVQLPLLAGGDHVYQGPIVADAGDGEAVVVWAEANSGYTSEWLMAARRKGDTWSAPQRISEPATVVRIESARSIAAAGAGDFLVGWTEQEEPAAWGAHVQELTGAGWTGEQTVESSGDRLYGLSLSADAAGHAAMVWADAESEEVHAASETGGAWTVSDPPGTHIRVVCDEDPPQVGVAADGQGVALWYESSGQLTSERFSAGGQWDGLRKTLTSITSEWFLNAMELGVDAEGDALAAWSAFDLNPPYETLTQASWQRAGGSWAPLSTLHSGSESNAGAPSLSVGEAGDGVAGWFEYANGNEYTIRAAGFEMRPVIEAIETPTLLSAGQEARLSARAVAPWAELSGAEWRFGDGTTAQGLTASHAYSTPGLYTVTLLVTDSLGNTATQTRQVDVVAATTPPVSPPAPARRLSPVYLQVAKHRLWLSLGGHTARALILNTNAFPVSGTVTIDPYFLPRKAGAASLRALAGVVRYTLAAHQTATIAFHITPEGLRRLHADVPDRGHILVRAKLTVHGAGLSASGAVVLALDQPLPPHRGRLRRPRVPSGYPAPVDPWARASC